MNDLILTATVLEALTERDGRVRASRSLIPFKFFLPKTYGLRNNARNTAHCTSRNDSAWKGKFSCAHDCQPEDFAVPKQERNNSRKDP